MSAKKNTKSAEKSKPVTAKTAKAKPEKKASAKATGDKKLSAINAAAKVLESSGEALTAKELIDAMSAKGLWTSPGGKTPHATLYSALIREITLEAQRRPFQEDRTREIRGEQVAAALPVGTIRRLTPHVRTRRGVLSLGESCGIAGESMRTYGDCVGTRTPVADPNLAAYLCPPLVAIHGQNTHRAKLAMCTLDDRGRGTLRKTR